MNLYLNPSKDKIPLILPLIFKRIWRSQPRHVFRNGSNSSENNPTAKVENLSSSRFSEHINGDQTNSNKPIKFGMCRLTEGKLHVITSASKQGFQENNIQSWNRTELAKRRESSLMFAIVSKPSSLMIFEEADTCKGDSSCSVYDDQDVNNPDNEELPLLFSLGTGNYEEALDIIGAAREAGNLCQSAATQLKELCHHLHMQDAIQAAAKPCCNRVDDIIIRQDYPHKETNKHEDSNVVQAIKTEKKDVPPQTYHVNLPRHSSQDTTAYHPAPQLKDNSSSFLSGSVGDEMTPVLQCVGEGQKKVDEPTPSDEPSKEQLYYMHHRLSEEMPRFFEQSHDYGLYSDSVHFDNRIMKVNTRGLPAYKATVQSLKYLSTAYLTNSQMEVLRITMETEQHCIQARWRIKGVPLHSYVLRPWSKTHSYRYFDAFSTFYVGNDGLIHTHVLDKVMPSSEGKVVASWPVRLGIMLGLIRPPAFETDIMKAITHMKSFLGK